MNRLIQQQADLPIIGFSALCGEDYAQETIARRLADQAVFALIEEVSLTPKPGLVDRASSNAHQDMDWALLVASAKALHSTFYQIALRGYNAAIDQRLREDIAKIGRQGEREMLQVTGGINTHKGAIWILGLLIAVLAHQYSRQVMQGRSIELSLDAILQKCGQLASFDDRNYQPQRLTKGQLSRQKYGIRGALEEAKEGFPTLRYVLSLPLTQVQDFCANKGTHRDKGAIAAYWYLQRDRETLVRLERLLQFISVVEDTCIISRSDLSTLRAVQATASTILGLGLSTEKGEKAYRQFCQDCLTYQLSPGGSADLLAAIIFLEKIGVINGTVTV